MNIQELINKAVSGVLNQGCLSKNPEPDKIEVRCFYRNPNNANIQCAVGHLISDEFYDKKLEQKSFETDEVMFAVERSIGRELNSEERRVLSDIQWCHDVSETLEDFKEHLKELDIRWEKDHDK